MKERMDFVRSYIASTFGEIKPEWEVALHDLEWNLNQQSKLQEDIDSYPLRDPDTGKINPSFKTLKDVTNTINNYLKSFGLTPYDFARIKQTPEDDTKNFFDALNNPHPQLSMDFEG